jgi:predicted transcriptional regulator
MCKKSDPLVPELPIPSPEAEVLVILLKLREPATVKRIGLDLPDWTIRKVYQYLVSLRENYGLVTYERRQTPNGALLFYQATPDAKAKFEYLLR